MFVTEGTQSRSSFAAFFNRLLAGVPQVVAEIAGRANESGARKIAKRIEQLVLTLLDERIDQPIALGISGPAIHDDLDESCARRSRRRDADRVGNEALRRARSAGWRERGRRARANQAHKQQTSDTGGERHVSPF